MEDYTSNSKKEREKQQKQENPPEKKIEKVVVGEVIQKPKGIWFKFKTVFLGGDAKNAARYVGTDVFLPAVRNVVYDVIRGYAERVIFPDTAQYRHRGPVVRYENQFRASNTPFIQSTLMPSDPRVQRSLPAQPQGRQNRHDMNDIILGTKEEAELVIERLIDVLDQYQVVSLGDLYDLLGLKTSYIDNKWGWTYLNNVQVKQIREGYLLELPPLEEL